MLCFLCPSLNLNAGIHCFAFKRQRPLTVWFIWSYQVFFFNMDIKFVEKLLAWCLETALPSIISLDHSGFIHDRHCFNLRQVFNVIHSAWSFDFFRHWEWFDWVKCLFFLNTLNYSASPQASNRSSDISFEYFQLYHSDFSGVEGFSLLYVDDLLLFVFNSSLSIPTAQDPWIYIEWDIHYQ